MPLPKTSRDQLKLAAKRMGVSYKSLSRRITQHGWSLERAIETPLRPVCRAETLEEAFADGVQAGGPDECWPWTKKSGTASHAQVTFKRKRYSVTRVAWELENKRPIPEGHVIRATCGNVRCCNPAHLVTATPAERNAINHRDGDVWLNETDVRDIREAYAAGDTTYPKLAAFYDVTPSTIAYIVRRQTWKHVSDHPISQETKTP